MKFPIEVVRLSQSDKDLLTKIKRKTGVDSWNVLCRWALTVALAQPNAVYVKSPEKRDSIEIKWDTFAGKNSSLYRGILLVHYSEYKQHSSELSMNDFFHSALSKGINILYRKASQIGILIFADKSFLR
jgi:DNA sulfur modification protein DndE